MANEQKKMAVPGIPLAALDAISDRNTRDVMRALVDTHHVRNGNAGSGDDRFVTAAEMGLIKGRAGSNLSRQGGSGSGGSDVVQIKPTDIGRIINELQAQVIESQLFKDLGQRITLIDAPHGMIGKLRDDLLTAANNLLAQLDTELGQLPDGVTDVVQVLDGAIKQLKAIKSTLYSAGGALPLASAAIIEINNVSTTSKSANASQLAGLSAAFYDPQTGLPASRADYVKLIETEAKAQLATAGLTETLNAQVNDVDTGLAASRTDYLNKIKLEADARTVVASSLNGLIGTVINPVTHVPFSDAMIAEERAVTLTNNTSLASQNNAVYAALGSKNRTYFSVDAPVAKAAVAAVAYKPAEASVPARAAIAAIVGPPAVPAIPARAAVAAKAPTAAVAPQEAVPVIGDIWYKTNDNNRARRWNGSAWVDASDTRVATVEGGITTEAGIRLANDNAVVQAINTVWTALGSSSALVQGGDVVTVNDAGATATAFKQVQAAIKDANGNLISSATIKNDIKAAVDKAGLVEAKWIVNLDVGGAAAGFRQAGFGISGSSTATGPTYAFGVRADQFWIATPGDTAQVNAPSAKVPFIVKTSTWTDARGQVQPAGVYLSDLFAASAKIGTAQIQTAMIADAQVNTLKIGRNAVTVPYANTFYGTTTGTGINNWFMVAEGFIDLDIAGVVFASSTALIAYGQGFCPAQSYLTINGVTVSSGGGDEAWVNASHSGGLAAGAGRVTVRLYFSAENRARMIDPTLYIQGAKR